MCGFRVCLHFVSNYASTRQFWIQNRRFGLLTCISKWHAVDQSAAKSHKALQSASFPFRFAAEAFWVFTLWFWFARWCKHLVLQAPGVVWVGLRHVRRGPGVLRVDRCSHSCTSCTNHRNQFDTTVTTQLCRCSEAYLCINSELR